jgi:hypothetical protein
MSYIAARFDYDQELLKDKELVDLYRVRDNDEFYKKPGNKALLYSNHNVMSEDGDLELIFTDQQKAMFNPANDPVWSSMDDKERLENGFITNYFHTYIASPKAVIGFSAFTSI